MPRSYDLSFKKSVVDLIVNHNHSTLQTAKDFNIPLKAIEKWITAYHKNNSVLMLTIFLLKLKLINLRKSLKKKTKSSIFKKIFMLSSILSIYSNSKGIYGAPKIKAMLERQNIFVSIRTVNHYMRILGIKSIVVKSYRNNNLSRISNEEKLLIVNLIKKLDITHPNQVWTTDIIYIKTVYDGTLYLVCFIDLFSKKIISWQLGYKMDSYFVNSTLLSSISKANPSPGLIIHSDKASQFRAKIYHHNN